MTKFKCILIWFVFLPYINVLLVSIHHLLANHITLINEQNMNAYSLIALVVIVFGVISGLLSLFVVKRINVWIRILIGVFYIPIAVVSLLLSGW